mmetsp:Transcript_89542/g.256465  ORF Transcript_89542/g.256465 Transcript_89542/m.256465 type:complete len:85 (+) Transcript_89542:1004-1258(+)
MPLGRRSGSRDEFSIGDALAMATIDFWLAPRRVGGPLGTPDFGIQPLHLLWAEECGFRGRSSVASASAKFRRLSTLQWPPLGTG